MHGAMCMSVSGRCLLSNYLTGKDANRGQCTQPCRWRYHLVEESRPDRRFTIGETPEGSYLLNADDLCAAPFIDLVCQAGVDSLKIEGRAKTFYYVASVTAAYRAALDAYMVDPQNYVCPERVLDELTRTSHRRYSTGFFFSREDARQNAAAGGYIREWEVVGVVDAWQDGLAACTQRGKFCLGDELEALQPLRRGGHVLPAGHLRAGGGGDHGDAAPDDALPPCRARRSWRRIPSCAAAPRKAEHWTTRQKRAIIETGGRAESAGFNEQGGSCHEDRSHIRKRHGCFSILATAHSLSCTMRRTAPSRRSRS